MDLREPVDGRARIGQDDHLLELHRPFPVQQDRWGAAGGHRLGTAPSDLRDRLEPLVAFGRTRKGLFPSFLFVVLPSPVYYPTIWCLTPHVRHLLYIGHLSDFGGRAVRCSPAPPFTAGLSEGVQGRKGRSRDPGISKGARDYFGDAQKNHSGLTVKPRANVPAARRRGLASRREGSRESGKDKEAQSRAGTRACGREGRNAPSVAHLWELA